MCQSNDELPPSRLSWTSAALVKYFPLTMGKLTAWGSQAYKSLPMCFRICRTRNQETAGGFSSRGMWNHQILWILSSWGNPLSQAIDMWALGVMAAEVVINPLLSTFNMLRSIIKTQGMLPEELLDDGKQTPYYFYWEVNERSVWRLKTMEEFYHDTRYRHENLDTFHSFDDILIAFQDCLHTVAFRLQHPSIILEQRILEVWSWTAQRAMKKSVVPFDIYLQS